MMRVVIECKNLSFGVVSRENYDGNYHWKNR